MRKKEEEIWQLNSDYFSQEREDSEGRKVKDTVCFSRLNDPEGILVSWRSINKLLFITNQSFICCTKEKAYAGFLKGSKTIQLMEVHMY